MTSWHPIGRNFLDYFISLTNFQNIFKFRLINFNNNRFRKSDSYKKKKPITLFLLCMSVCVLCDIVHWCNRWNSNLFNMVFKYQSEMFHHVSDILGLKNQKSDNFVKFPYIVMSPYTRPTTEGNDLIKLWNSKYCNRWNSNMFEKFFRLRVETIDDYVRYWKF